jgi:hypothetical protein
MENSMEKRSMERISIPDAQVYYRSNQAMNYFTLPSGPMSLINISKSGACFEFRDQIPSGSPVKLKIVIQGGKKIIARGQVIWTSKIGGNTPCAGVQFLPFGKSKKYNSLQTLSRLRKLTDNLH